SSDLLFAYLNGCFTHARRAIYSKVKATVKNHSKARRLEPYRMFIVVMLSSITTATLSNMAAISAKSNHRPALVSASKIITNKRSRNGDSGLPKYAVSFGLIGIRGGLPFGASFFIDTFR